MKIYVLVEGISTEMAVYPAWFESLIPIKPVFTCIEDFERFVSADRGIYFVSGQGYPSIINHISNSIENSKSANADYLIIVIDSDEDAPKSREMLIREEFKKWDIPDRLHIVIIVQNRCFETYLLANRRCMPRVPKGNELLDFRRYYDIHDNDPELMGNYNDDYTHSQFHFKYASTALRENRLIYSKSNASCVCNEGFLNEIIGRSKETNHIKSFSNLIDNVNQIRKKMSLESI